MHHSAQAAAQRRIPTCQIEALKNSTKQGSQNMGRGQKTVWCWLLSCSQVPTMACQYCADTKEGRKNPNVCRLLRPQQSDPER